jgi:hypothetical protein
MQKRRPKILLVLEKGDLMKLTQFLGENTPGGLPIPVKSSSGLSIYTLFDLRIAVSSW